MKLKLIAYYVIFCLEVKPNLNLIWTRIVYIMNATSEAHRYLEKLTRSTWAGCNAFAHPPIDPQKWVANNHREGYKTLI